MRCILFAKYVHNICVKKLLCDEQVKQFVVSLLGMRVSVKHNRGRNRIKTYNGVVSEAHPNVFLITDADVPGGRLSCSYSDVLCGEITLKPIWYLLFFSPSCFMAWRHFFAIFLDNTHYTHILLFFPPNRQILLVTFPSCHDVMNICHQPYVDFNLNCPCACCFLLQKGSFFNCCKNLPHRVICRKNRLLGHILRLGGIR